MNAHFQRLAIIGIHCPPRPGVADTRACWDQCDDILEILPYSVIPQLFPLALEATGAR